MTSGRRYKNPIVLDVYSDFLTKIMILKRQCGGINFIVEKTDKHVGQVIGSTSTVISMLIVCNLDRMR